jgi:hypothetical protein
MTFEVLMALSIKIMVSWDVKSCNLIGRYQCFRRTCCWKMEEAGFSEVVVPILQNNVALHGRRQ